MTLPGEKRKDFLRGAPVSRENGLPAVGGYYVRQGVKDFIGGLARGDSVIGNERGTGQQQGYRAGDHDDQHDLATQRYAMTYHHRSSRAGNAG
jgi:hypothetical protein